MPVSSRTLLTVLAIALLAPACAPAPSDKKNHVSEKGCAVKSAALQRPRAVAGVLDLSGYNIDRQGPVALDGEWEFYWKQFIDPITFQGPTHPRAEDFIAVPGFWNGHRVDNKTLGAEGFATYRLTVKNCAYRGMAGFKLNQISTAYTLFVNGKMVYQCGRPGKDRAHAVPRWMGDAAYFTSEADTIDIVLHVSNYHYVRGGIYMPIRLGAADEIKTSRERFSWIEFFIFGTLCIMGLYHVGLGALRRNDLTPLYFGLLCLIMTLRTLASGEIYLAHMIPAASWELLHKFEYGTFTMAVPLCMFYINSLFPDESNRKAIILIAAVCGAVTLLIMATPSLVYSRTVVFFQLFALATIAYSVFIIILAVRRNREGSVNLLAGFIIITLAIINDMLYENGMVRTTYTAHMALFVFIFMQAYQLLLRFSNSFNRIERLTEDLQRTFNEIEKKNISLISTNRELEELKNGLEEIVEERTEELNAALTEMESINDQLILTNRSLNKAHKAAEADMKMAANVQTAVILKNPPRTDEWDIACRYIPMTGVSGDFYDFYNFGGRLAGVGLFDVSGHGISSGLITMTAKTILFRLFREYHDKNFSQTFTRFNRELYREIGQAYYYLTGILLRFNGMRAEYLNAAHTDVLVKGSSGVRPVRHDNGEENCGFLLGIQPEDYQYSMIPFTVASGDVIAIFTDGIVEANKIETEPYGMDRVMASFESAPDGSSEEILDHLLRDVFSFTGDTTLKDDLTIIVMRRK